MQCPICGTANPAQARFCIQCGSALVDGVVCATCHTLLPNHARFCFHCGAMVVPPLAARSSAQALPQPEAASPGTPATLQPAPGAARAQVEPPAPPQAAGSARQHRPQTRTVGEMLPALRRYLPARLYEPLERRPTEHDLLQVRDHLAALLRTTKTYLPRPVVDAPQPAGEPAGGMYKGVFLFGDVSGFTPLSEQLKSQGNAGAERMTEIINDMFTDLVRVLVAHGGVLLKFGGDALLGVFPANNDTEMSEGALRAVQAARAMQTAMEKFAAIRVREDAEPLALRIKCGISSGPYFAAHIGTPPQPEMRDPVTGQIIRDAHLGTMAYVTTGRTVNRADQAEGHANPGEVVVTGDALALLNGQVQVAPVTKDPDDHFHRVTEAPPAEVTFDAEASNETPEGDAPTQIAYLAGRMDLLAPYLNPELLNRIADNTEARILPENRVVTAMFVNYEGVSELIEDMGDTAPELITRHLNRYFVKMAGIVEEFEGTLARMDQYSVGDRLVIFFGAPRAHEDDPARAVQTALKMQQVTRDEFTALDTDMGVYQFRQRVGVNTGSLFASNVGARNLRQEYTLMGDDINMAARLMSKAGWGDIFISEKTQERIEAYFETEDQGALTVKGKAIPIQTYKVSGYREQVGRTRGLASGDAPLTGRDGALHTLQQCVYGVVNGRGQIVSVVGESGLGKSRLIRELKAWTQNENGAADVRWLEGHALSFSEQVSYWLAIQTIPNALALKPDANKADIRYALWERCKELLGKENAREAFPYLAHMLELPLAGQWEELVRELDPQVRQKQTFWAAREFFKALAHERPTVVVLDDLHWADEASLALFQNLLEVCIQAPLMFVLAFRPMREKGSWRLRDHANRTHPHRFAEVTLAPLTEDESRALLGALLPGAVFPPAVWQDIFDKTAGNPFYLEEVVRSLIDTGAAVQDTAAPDYTGDLIRAFKRRGPVEDQAPPHWRLVPEMVHEIAVPDTLHGAILARIDRLTEDARQALQMASVIGRRFEVKVLSRIGEAEAELSALLAQLERSDLIQPEDLVAQAYSFRDALVEEVAYENLLSQRRMEFHLRVGETLEEVYADRRDQEAALLAYHFSRSNDRARAVQYLEMAGRKAQAEFANDTAIQHYTDLLALLGDNENAWERRFDTLSRRQAIFDLTKRQQDRARDLDAMMAFAEAHNDQRRRAQTLNGYALLHQDTGNYDRAVAAAQEALEIAAALGDQANQAQAVHTLGVVAYFRGNYAEARPALEQAMALRQALNDAAGEAWSTMYLGMIHFREGRLSEAAALHERAYEVAQARQDMFQVGIHLTNAARVSLRRGEYEKALKQFEQSLEMKRRVEDRNGQGFSMFQIGLANVYLDCFDDAEKAINEALEIRQQSDDHRGVSECYFGLGLAALGRRQYSQAEKRLQQACDARTRLGLKAELVADLSYLGVARLGLGRTDEAVEVSAQAVALLAEQPGVEEPQQVYLNHYRILAARKDPNAADWLEQAHRTMMSQAQRVGDDVAQQAFLEQVKVNREIVADAKALGIG